MKKKNFIGDDIIAEREELAEATDRSSDNKAKPAQETKELTAYQKKMNKINQIYEDSTADYKQQ